MPHSAHRAPGHYKGFSTLFAVPAYGVYLPDSLEIQLNSANRGAADIALVWEVHPVQSQAMTAFSAPRTSRG